VRFGVELHQYLDAQTILKESRAVEELGYDALWLGDSQLIWRELYVLLGAAAVATRRVTLGVGVTNPITRHPAVTASAMMTLQELSGGRGILGVGLGHTSLVTMGFPRATRKQLAAYVAAVRGLCRGEEVAGGHGPLRLAFARGTPPPIIAIGGSGPKMLQLAGEIADGAILSGQLGHPEVRREALQRLDALARKASEPFPVHAGMAACVSRDRTAALDAVRPHVASGLRSPLARLSPIAREARDRVVGAYNVHDHMHPGAAHAAAIPDEIVPEFSIAGTPEECAAQCQAIFADGIDEVTIRPYALPGASRLEMIETFAREVISRLR
jgi:5,10-methylenetetrahydromethanopterin reductase